MEEIPESIEDYYKNITYVRFIKKKLQNNMLKYAKCQDILTVKQN